MKREYLQSLPRAADIKNEAYNAYLESVVGLFNEIEKQYNMEKSEHLWE